MSTGSLIFLLLFVGMVAMHLFGHSRHGAGAAGGGHGGGGCCGGGGHAHGGHGAGDSERRPKDEHEPEETVASGPVADESAARPAAKV